MEIYTIEIKKLKAGQGKVLTDGNTFSDVGGAVYLGVNDTADRWQEISKEEYDIIKETANE